MEDLHAACILLQAAEGHAAEAQTAQQAQQDKAAALRAQLEQAGQRSAALAADNAALRQKVRLT